MFLYSRVASPVTLVFLAFLWAVALHGPGSISHLLVLAASALGFGACAASVYVRVGRTRFTWGRAVALASAVAVGGGGGLLAAERISGPVTALSTLLALAVVAAVGGWLHVTHPVDGE